MHFGAIEIGVERGVDGTRQWHMQCSARGIPIKE
jgi:hypothetical protein